MRRSIPWATIALSCLAAFWAAAPGLAAPPSPAALAERQHIAEQGGQILAAATAAASNASDLAAALDVDPSRIISSSLTGPGQASAALSNLGVIQPIRGSSFVILSTGVVGSIPEPGTDFDLGGSDGDSVTFTLVLSTPPGASRLSFNFNFLSAEYPDFIGSQFNDTFTVSVTDQTGTRPIAGASVNSSFFFPASSSRAGGSGFDIFSEDPEGVDQVFGSGLPDAGLTDFQTVDIPVQSSGQITVHFSVEDLGDGVLDSAVLLDNFNLAAIEAVDASNPAFLVGSGVTSNPQLVAAGGEPRIGVAADGVSRLILRTRVAGPGTVDWCLDGGTASQDGGFDQLGGNDRLPCVSAAVTQTSVGSQAFTVYRAPDEFNRGGDESLDKRPLRIKARFTPFSGSPVESTLEIQIVRPPVLLVHGLWSEPGTWKLPLRQDVRFFVDTANYKDTNASHFSTNVPFVKDAIKNQLDILRRRGYAATQVDLVGHSMGGILGRIWAASPSSRKAENFGAGEIHKLITLDTPHTGSPIANALHALGQALDSTLLAQLIHLFYENPNQGAIEDLQVGSAPLRSLAASPIPSHALVGTGGSQLVGDIGTAGSSIPGTPGAVFRLLAFYGSLSNLFPGLQHDLVVGRNSQEGGLPAAATSVYGLPDGVHFGVPGISPGNTGSPAYSQRVVDLLNTPGSAGTFSRFSAGKAQTLAEPSPFLSVYQPYPVRSVQEGLRIDSPASGSTVQPGQTIEVVVEPIAGAPVQRVLVVGPFIAETDTTSPFRVLVTIPSDAVGDLQLGAFGANDAGISFTANEVVLHVVPPGAVESLEILPAEGILRGPGASLHLTTLGTYTDSTVRDVSDPDTGTTYQTADAQIATVSATGVVTATGLGTTTIVARHGDVQDSITIRVVEAPALCTSSAGNLCLNQGRFRVSLEWVDSQGNRGPARVVPYGSDDSGLLWFFSEDNWEMLVKVLNGCSLNDHFWVFAAATTNVGYTLTVVDELTGESKTYTNPQGRSAPALTDTQAFATCFAGGTTTPARSAATWASTLVTEAVPAAGTAASACSADAQHLCLNQQRFRVEVSWRDFQNHTGTASVVPFGSEDSGLFWFFSDQNWEMLVKVLNGCGLNQRYWVFAAAVTNVEYTLRVTDTATGVVKKYENPLGVASAAITDTGAFAACP